jgi:hypothetical protein
MYHAGTLMHHAVTLRRIVTVATLAVGFLLGISIALGFAMIAASGP